MSIVTYNNRSIVNISAIPSAVKSLTHIKTLTASSSATLSFVDGSSDVVLDSTYPIYLFKFINIHPATDNVNLTVNFRDGGSDFDATKTTSYFHAYHDEADSGTSVGENTSNDIAQGTGYQMIGHIPGNDNDQSVSGTLYLFSPASTTFVKHFISNFNSYTYHNYSLNTYVGGYCNVTAAIDGVDFKFSSGNIDSGVIKMYGLSKS